MVRVRTFYLIINFQCTEALKSHAKWKQTTFVFLSEKIRLDISCESYVQQTVQMKCQALLNLKNKI